LSLRPYHPEPGCCEARAAFGRRWARRRRCEAKGPPPARDTWSMVLR